MPASKAQQKAVHKYTKENYDRFLVAMKPKGRLETVKAHAAAHGESTNAFIGRAIMETMDRDGAGGPQEATGGPIGGDAVSLHPEALKTAQEAAWSAGETVQQFIERAVNEQANRDVCATGKVVGESVDDVTTTVQPVPRGTFGVVRDAAKAAGEKPGDFIFRAVTTQAKRDEVARKMEGRTETLD